MMPTDRDDHEALRSYLLGELPEPEADRFEERVFADRDLFELASAVEAELIEACARGELPRERCAGLLTRLGNSPGGRQRLVFQRALVTGLSMKESPVRVGAEPFPGRSVRTLTAGRHRFRPSWRTGKAAAALAAGLSAAVVAGWIAFRTTPHEPVPGPQVATEVAEPAAAANGHNRGVPVPIPPEIRGTEVIPDAPGREAPAVPHRPQAPAHRSRPERLLPQICQLAISDLRGTSDEEQTIEAADSSRPVELHVDLGGEEDSPILRATVAITGGEAVWTKDIRPTSGDESVVLDLPAGVLSADGRYKLSIEGVSESGETTTIGNVTFRVIAPQS